MTDITTYAIVEQWVVARKCRRGDGLHIESLHANGTWLPGFDLGDFNNNGSAVSKDEARKFAATYVSDLSHFDDEPGASAPGK